MEERGARRSRSQEKRRPAVPSPKDEAINEEMQMEVSVTRVGKWEERVVMHWPNGKDWCARCWSSGRYQGRSLWDSAEKAGLPEFPLRYQIGSWGFLAEGVKDVYRSKHGLRAI